MTTRLFETDRLLLRAWRQSDRAAFAALNADAVVMEHFPGTQSHEQSDATVDRIERSFAERGFGPWAVEVKGGAPFIGFVGLLEPGFTAVFTPCVEVGWRLAAAHWGRGYATEGAGAALAFGFDEVGLEEILSFTTTTNVRSIAVMERLGMTHDPADDFDHPALAGHALARHVLYRISRERFASVRSARRAAPASSASPSAT